MASATNETYSAEVPEHHPEHPRNLIPELCRNMYNVGWVTGTGGGVSIKHGGDIYVAPSGVQKERIKPDDLYRLSADGAVLEGPRHCPSAEKLKQSECTPLFMNAYTKRNAGACIHTHSQNAVMATLLWDKEFRVSHIEMIKGLRNGVTGQAMGFRDTVVVPIIDNTDFERDLTEAMAEAMDAYPEACCVLVRRHGCYVWGSTWQRAKGMAECYDYLFEMAIKMRQAGIATEHPKEASEQQLRPAGTA